MMVRKALALGIGPLELLRAEILYAESPQDLRQRRRKAEAIRQPAHLGIHAKLFPEPLLSPLQLPYQAFAGGKIGIAFHIEGAFGYDLPPAIGILHPLPQKSLESQRIQGFFLSC